MPTSVPRVPATQAPAPSLLLTIFFIFQDKHTCCSLLATLVRRLIPPHSQGCHPPLLLPAAALPPATPTPHLFCPMLLCTPAGRLALSPTGCCAAHALCQSSRRRDRAACAKHLRQPGRRQGGARCGGRGGHRRTTVCAPCSVPGARHAVVPACTAGARSCWVPAGQARGMRSALQLAQHSAHSNCTAPVRRPHPYSLLALLRPLSSGPARHPPSAPARRRCSCSLPSSSRRSCSARGLCPSPNTALQEGPTWAWRYSREVVLGAR